MCQKLSHMFCINENVLYYWAKGQYKKITLNWLNEELTVL